MDTLNISELNLVCINKSAISITFKSNNFAFPEIVGNTFSLNDSNAHYTNEYHLQRIIDVLTNIGADKFLKLWKITGVVSLSMTCERRDYYKLIFIIEPVIVITYKIAVAIKNLLEHRGNLYQYMIRSIYINLDNDNVLYHFNNTGDELVVSFWYRKLLTQLKSQWYTTNNWRNPFYLKSTRFGRKIFNLYNNLYSIDAFHQVGFIDRIIIKPYQIDLILDPNQSTQLSSLLLDHIFTNHLQYNTNFHFYDAYTTNTYRQNLMMRDNVEI